MVIREAREVDMGAIAELCQNSLMKIYEALMAPGKSMPWTEGEDIKKYIRGNWPTMRVAWAEDQLVGLIATHRNHIDILWVSEETRQQGIGQKLLAETEQSLESRYADITAECLTEASIHFFQSRGYDIQRQFTDGMSGVEKVVMSKVLEASDRE
ncbi:GNAT family N-acetyltransferase [Endozoicomonas numazuensis]|uniref:N-acetyltransferase domain-containing protein n=1 Tax=Endozoicomonas numazuensis TaxID=1137799 RepID=A0A081ND49_9GAMM|nr:GNAT family N-acetyltransferase [Endozoicomonas numazuensis]KEQ16372.1 hypothetical protein GZ78_21060 [Endozoicomonas numazuensis]